MISKNVSKTRYEIVSNNDLVKASESARPQLHKPREWLVTYSCQGKIFPVFSNGLWLEVVPCCEGESQRVLYKKPSCQNEQPHIQVYGYMHFFLEACACQGNTDQSLGLCVRGFSNQFYRQLATSCNCLPIGQEYKFSLEKNELPGGH